MKGYNLYYKNERLNNLPLSKEELLEMINDSNKYIYKHNSILHKTKEIKKTDIKIIECTIV